MVAASPTSSKPLRQRSIRLDISIERSRHCEHAGVQKKVLGQTMRLIAFLTALCLFLSAQASAAFIFLGGASLGASSPFIPTSYFAFGDSITYGSFASRYANNFFDLFATHLG